MILQNINGREEIIEETTRNCPYLENILALTMKELMHFYLVIIKTSLSHTTVKINNNKKRKNRRKIIKLLNKNQVIQSKQNQTAIR